MSRTLQLMEYVQATANAAGTATAIIGPKKYGDRWTVQMLATSTTSTTETTLTVYRGSSPVPTARVAFTYSGNADTASGKPIELSSSDRLTFVWSGASTGAVCTCRLEGELISERF